MSTTSDKDNESLESSSACEVSSSDSLEAASQVDYFWLLQEISPKVQQEMDLIDAIVQAQTNRFAKK